MTKGFIALLLGSSALTFAAVWLMAAPTAAPPPLSVKSTAAQSSVYYAGCREAQAAGVTPLHAGEPGYREGMDGDGDGIACESY